MVKKSIVLAALVLLACRSFQPAPAVHLRVPALFGDHMVLQQDKPAIVWGWADPGGRITARFAGKERWILAGKNGTWRISLPVPPSAGGPYELTIAGADTLIFRDILIGEVWICSGQSNMEMPLAGWGRVNDYENEIAKADYPAMRLFTVKRGTSHHPKDDVETDGWHAVSPATVESFSATAYFFGRHLHEHLSVPIGLIHTSWGGTAAEAWTSAASLRRIPDFAALMDSIAKVPPANDEELKDRFKLAMEKWRASINAADQGLSGGWYGVLSDPGGWKTMRLPSTWETAGLENLDGVVWFRRTVQVPAGWRGKRLYLELGPIDDEDETWFNGVKVGTTSGYAVPRRYEIPTSLVSSGLNEIAVRVLDTHGYGGIWGKPEEMKLKDSYGNSVSLAGNWRYRIAIGTREMPPEPLDPLSPNHPTVLFNAMIAPLVPFPVRGFIWYQGESNAGRAYQYRTLFPAMIRDWRSHWKAVLPFYFVQLANYKQTKPQPSEDDWAELREAQSMALNLPNTGMAVAIDIGDAADIHPKNKQAVGTRLALIARAKLYGHRIPYSGPLWSSMKAEGNHIRLAFAHTDSGLVSMGGPLRGFAIAGADSHFVWATAEIDGNTVLVSNAEGSEPVAVRYSWESNPIGNLYNGAGLPASPFRTDDWPGITEGVK